MSAIKVTTPTAQYEVVITPGLLRTLHRRVRALSPHSRLIVTFALCGFANFGSLGILVGGLTAMLPDRRAEVVSLGLRSLVSGTLATCLSGAVAGLLTP